MKKGWIVPPECCVIIEMEQGASLGYRKAVLLNEIGALASLEKAAKTSRLDAGHARNARFSMIGRSSRAGRALVGACSSSGPDIRSDSVVLAIMEKSMIIRGGSGAGDLPMSISPKTTLTCHNREKERALALFVMRFLQFFH